MKLGIAELTKAARAGDILPLPPSPPADTDNTPDAADALKAITGGAVMPPPIDAPKMYTVRGMGSLVMEDQPPLEYLWNGIALIAGGVVEVIGAPGIGKSRVVCDLARHQIRGADFGGRATLKTPIKWLFAGSENGINRLDFEAKAYFLKRKPSEVRGMSEADRLAIAAENGYSKDDLDLLDANFRTFTLENPEDYDISLMDKKNIEKLVETLKVERPRILAVDPWGDVIAGKELDDGDVRLTVRILRGCLAMAGLRDSLLVIVNHARMGAKEEANARGQDEGNFGKNSKCLYSIARYVINIRRASFDDSPDIELINAKNNDGRKQPPIALHLDADSMSYELVENFDHDKWQETLEEAAKENGRGGGKASKKPDELLEGAIKILEAAGEDLLSVSRFKEKMVEAGLVTSVGATSIREFLKARRSERGDEARIVFHQEVWRQGDRVTEKPKNRGGSEFISTPSHMGRYLRGWGINVSC